MFVAVYGILTYFYFFYVLLGAISFTMNGKEKVPTLAPYFPWTIDGPVKDGDMKHALIVDASFLALFAIQHLVMARKGWKKMFNAQFPESSERSTFVLAASAVLHGMMHHWHPVNTIIWSVPPSLTSLTYGVWVFGWLLVLLATFNIDHFELFGLKQSTGFSLVKQEGFVATYLYRYIRHPIMTGFLIAFWATPIMTVGHLLFAGMCTGFILFTVYFFEEPDLVKDIGQEYRDYQKQVPAFCPIPGMTWTKKANKSS